MIKNIAILVTSAAVSVGLGEIFVRVAGVGGQAVNMATWEVIKGSRIVKSAVSALGEQFSKFFESLFECTPLRLTPSALLVFTSTAWQGGGGEQDVDQGASGAA